METGKCKTETGKWKIETRDEFHISVTCVQFQFSTFQFRFSSFQLPVSIFQFLFSSFLFTCKTNSTVESRNAPSGIACGTAAPGIRFAARSFSGDRAPGRVQPVPGFRPCVPRKRRE